MVVANDQQLLAWASEQAEELFPSLSRRVFGPLLVVLAVLPGMYAVVYGTLDARDSLWALRALDVYTADSPAEAIAPGQRGPEAALRWQPPLASWLTALVFAVLGPAESVSTIAVSYASVAALVAVAYLLAEQWGGSRLAFWTVLALSLHGPLLAQAQDPSAPALTQLLMVGAFYCFWLHRDRNGKRPSMPILAGGACLGLGLLAGGSVALGAMLVLLLAVLAERSMMSKSSRGAEAPRRTWRGWQMLVSLAWMFLIAMLVGGWWPAWLGARHGEEFWRGWISARVPLHDDQSTGPITTGRLLFELFGPLSGLALLGFWQALRELVRTTEAGRRERLTFILTWALVGLGGWLALYRIGAAGEPFWRGFLLVGWILLAAWSLECICRRQVHVTVVIGVACATAIALLWPAASEVAMHLSSQEAVWSGLAALVVIVLAWSWLLRFCCGGDMHQRLILAVLILAVLAGNAVAGLAIVRESAHEDRVLRAFRSDLAGQRNVEAWTLIAAEDPPLPLWWTLRSLWPHAAWRAPVATWDGAVSQALSEELGPRRKLLVVDWQEHESRPSQVRGLNVRRVTRGLVLKQRPLTAYAVTTGP